MSKIWVRLKEIVEKKIFFVKKGFSLVGLIILASVITNCGKPEKEEKTPSHLNVVVTLKPLHSLVSGLMEGRGVPVLLMNGRTSPHTAILKPSQRKALQTADLLVWIGPDFEVFLEKAVRGLKPFHVLTLLDAPDMTLLNQACHHDHGGHGIKDGHIWMDPYNGLAIARAVLNRLIEIDPEGRSLYERNFAHIQKEIHLLDQEIKNLLSPHVEKPFFVVHQAYAYFVHRYHIRPPETILSSAEGVLSPKNLLKLSHFLKKNPKGCVFFEPQFTSVLEKLRAFVRVRGGQIGRIDPIGMEDTPGPGLYCLLLRRCARSLVWCFSPS